MLQFLVPVVALSGGRVAVTNITESHSDINTAECGIRFNADGSIEVGKGTGFSPVYTSIHPREWWTKEPATGIGNNYQVRCASVTTGSPDLLWSDQAAAIGTYITMSAGRVWTVRAQGGKIGPNTKSITVSSFQIRNLTSLLVMDTFNISVTAIRT